MSGLDLKAVATFLYAEADALDKADLDSWMQLYTVDGAYWMPARENQPDPLNHISHIYDDRVMMEIRRRNFVHPRASSKDPGVRCSHIISNIQHRGHTENGDAIISSNFQILMWYREQQRHYGGAYEHHLQLTGDGFLIRHKKVVLINPEAAHQSIPIYL